MERTIDKVLSQTESELISKIDSGFQDSLSKLDASRTTLQTEYEIIIESAKKEAENLKRQIIGSSRLSARNKELILIESAVNEIFSKAKEKLQSKSSDKLYKDLLRKMIEESVSRLDYPEIIIESNKTDFDAVKKILQDLTINKKVKLSLSKKPIEIVGGIRAHSADESMTLDNTLDSKIERLKPLIRKEVVQLLRGE